MRGWAPRFPQPAELPLRRAAGCSRRQVRRWGVWAVLVLLLGSCEPDLIDLDVRGSVTDRLTGEPIAGAPVILTWTRGYADLDVIGTESGPDGRYRLFVYRFPCDGPALTTGLDPYEAETVDIRCVETEQTVDFALTAEGSR